MLSPRVLVAPDSFKGTLSSHEAAEFISRGIHRVWPAATITSLPLADGGEGSVQVLHSTVGGTRKYLEVEGPLGQPIRASFLLLPDGQTAVVEMAEASGLLLCPPERRDPLAASTFGTGQLLAAALTAGVDRIIVFLGGSATTDGGAGMAEALGYRLLDSRNDPLPRGGGMLDRLHSITAAASISRFDGITVVAATDVTNPLCGPEGAAAVYGPQKGARPAEVARLERGLERLADVVERDLGRDIRRVPGAGAAGGLGAGLLAFLGASVASGAEVLMDAVGIDPALQAADVCFTGEGRIDSQSSSGKLLSRLAGRCSKAGVALVALGGSIAEGVNLGPGTILLSTTRESGPPPSSTSQAGQRLVEAASAACSLMEIGAAWRG